MTGISRVWAIGVVAALGGCLPFAVPPSRVDVGPTVVHTRAGGTSGMRVQAGAHLASAQTRRDIAYDIGVGYVYERVAMSDIDRDAVAMTEYDRYGDRPTAATSEGGYIELARRIARSGHHRTWLAVRGERLWEDEPVTGSGDSFGLSARLEWELFTPAVGSGADAAGDCGFVVGISHGSAAIGMFVESGARRYPDGTNAFIATAGLSARLPALMGIAADPCSILRR